MIRKNIEKAFEMKDKLKQFHFPIVFYMTTQNLETAMGDISISKMYRKVNSHFLERFVCFCRRGNRGLTKNWITIQGSTSPI